VAAPIQFIGFAPDLDPATPGVITATTGLIPSVKGFKSCPSGGSTGYAALAAACRGAAVLTKLDGTSRFIAGTATKLYEGASAAWTERTRGGGTPSNYTVGTAGRWRFAVFGNSVLAVDGRGADVLQRSPTDVFADVTGPKADCIATNANFVMLAATNEAVHGDQSDRWWCSAILDETSWTESVATQCTSGRLVDAPGPILGLRALGSDFVAYKAASIFVGRYVGPPVVFAWIRIPGDIGAVSHESIVDIGPAHLFVGNDDIWQFDGSRPQSIGAPLREWFYRRLDKANKHLITALHDRLEGNVWWFYPYAGNPGVLAEAIVYNYKSGKWGMVTNQFTVETAIEWISDAMTYATLGTLYSSYASIPSVSYDSPIWYSTNRVPAFFDTAHALKSLDGESGLVTFTTGMYGDDQQRMLMQRMRPNFKSAPTTCTLAELLYCDVSAGPFSSDTVMQSISEQRFDVLRSSRWFKFNVYCTGNFEIAGMSFDWIPDGVE
jgi:hypothetical protein